VPDDKNKTKYPEAKLSNKLIGLTFEAYNSIGSGFEEKIYQNVYEELLIRNKIDYERELYCNLIVFDKKVGRYRLDFLVKNRIIVELKCRNEIYPKDISQVINYLKVKNIKIGLIFKFGKNGVEIKRLIN